MKKHLIITIILCLFYLETQAQNRAKYVLEGQVLGNAPFLAIKINRNFWLANDSHFTVGTGYGYFANLASIPVDLSFSTGKNNKFLELGATGDFYITTPKDGPKSVFSPLIGYKSISQKGVVFRIHFAPLILGEFAPWAGLSLGGILR